MTRPEERDAPHATPARRVYPVGRLLAGLAQLLEDRVGRLWVVGEIGDLHVARSGHVYFSLKDDEGQVRAALFRSSAQRVPFELDDGMEVLVYADVSIYAPRGDLQLVVRAVEPRGVGALQLAFEQLRRRLDAEGLFDASRKREIPSYPRRIGVVTSPDGAAVRDVIHVAARRFPGTPLLVSPTRVQGDGADREIARALALVTTAPGCDDVDVVLLVRGGGSLEDLVAFNSEAVARAIAACPVPVISGVGHETDVTIADLAADARAPTPSAAAMLALPDGAHLRLHLRRDARRLRQAVLAGVAKRRERLGRERMALRALTPAARLAARRARLAKAVDALHRSLPLALARRRATLDARVGRLDSLSPLAVLSRGYALVRRASDGSIVRRAGDLAPGERLRIRLAEGELAATADTEAASPGRGRPSDRRAE